MAARTFAAPPAPAPFFKLLCASSPDGLPHGLLDAVEPGSATRKIFPHDEPNEVCILLNSGGITCSGSSGKSKQINAIEWLGCEGTWVEVRHGFDA